MSTKPLIVIVTHWSQVTHIVKTGRPTRPKVTKSFPSRKQAHVGMEASKTMTPQHFHTIPTSCAILPPLTQICFVFVSCVQRRVVEGSGVGSGGCVVHFDVHGE